VRDDRYIRFDHEIIRHDDGCITPVLGQQPDGYHRLKFKGETWPAHRLSYHLNVKKIPRKPPNLREGLVLHECDNKACINPGHIYLGTQKQNMKDKVERFDGLSEILSKAKLGKKLSPEHAGAIGKAHTGLKRSFEARKRMSEAAKNRKRTRLSEAHRAAISAGNMGKKRSEEAKANMRAAWSERKGI
jgi:hypothetical protein